MLRPKPFHIITAVLTVFQFRIKGFGMGHDGVRLIVEGLALSSKHCCPALPAWHSFTAQVHLLSSIGSARRSAAHSSLPAALGICQLMESCTLLYDTESESDDEEVREPLELQPVSSPSLLERAQHVVSVKKEGRPSDDYQRAINFSAVNFAKAQELVSELPQIHRSKIVLLNVANLYVEAVDIVTGKFDASVSLRFVRRFDDETGPPPPEANEDIALEKLPDLLAEIYGVTLNWDLHQACTVEYSSARLFGGPGGQCDVTLRGTFQDTNDLEFFPFDIQDFNVIFEVRFLATVPDFHLILVGDVNSQQTMPDYTFYQPLAMMYARKWPYRKISITTCALRNYGHYLMNYYLQLCVLTSAFPLVSAIDPHEGTADRLSFLVTLILATAALQITMNANLPCIPYATMLTRYTTTSFTVMSMSMFLCVLTSRMPWWWDTATFGGLFVFWIGYNANHFLTARRSIWEARRLLGSPAETITVGSKELATASAMMDALDPRFGALLQLRQKRSRG